MSKMFSLFKILFKSMYGISSLKYKSSKNKLELLKALGILIIVIIALSPMVAGYSYYLTLSYDVLLQFNQAGAILTTGIVASSVLVIFFGFFYVISTFYFTSDTQYLVSLPLKPSQIIGAKLGVILVSEYITELPLMLPPIIIFGIKSGAGILYWIYSLAAILTVPLIPLCLTSILAILVMRLINFGRKKDLLTIIGGILAMVMILGVQMYIQRAAVSGDPQQIQNALFSENGIIGTVAKVFPPAGWISIALAGYGSMNGFLYLLLFAGVSIAFILAFELIAEKLFLGGYIGSQEIEAKRKKIDESELAREVKAGSRMMAIFWREFRILNRVPVFFMNNVLVIVLIPAIFILMHFSMGSKAFNEIQALIGTGGQYTAGFVITGIAIFTVAAGMTAPTSLSREGAQFFVSKYIPVSPREQILGKALHSLLLAGAGDLLVVATLGFMFNLTIPIMIMAFVISVLAAVPIIEIGLIIDLFRPLLVWDNPQKAVKQNLNGVLSMFLNMLWGCGFIFLAANFVPGPTLGFIVLFVIFALLGFVLYRALMSYAAKRYVEIEP